MLYLFIFLLTDFQFHNICIFLFYLWHHICTIPLLRVPMFTFFTLLYDFACGIAPQWLGHWCFLKWITPFPKRRMKSVSFISLSWLSGYFSLKFLPICVSMLSMHMTCSVSKSLHNTYWSVISFLQQDHERLSTWHCFYKSLWRKCDLLIKQTAWKQAFVSLGVFGSCERVLSWSVGFS